MTSRLSCCRAGDRPAGRTAGSLLDEAELGIARWPAVEQVVVLAAQEPAEERRQVGLLGAYRAGRVDGSDRAGDEAFGEADLAGDLRDQPDRVLVGVLPARALQGQVGVPAGAVVPQRF